MKTITAFLVVIITVIFNNNAAWAHSVELDFYTMFEEHGTVMLLINADTGRIEHANKAAAKFYGYSVDQLESMTVQQIINLPPEEIQSRINKAANERSSTFTVEQRLATGEIRTVEVYSCPHESNGHTLLFAIIYDITDKILLEQKYRLIDTVLFSVLSGALLITGLISYMLLRNLRKVKILGRETAYFNNMRATFFDADDNMICLKDENLKYIFVNKAFKTFYQLDEDQIKGHGDFELAPEEFAEIQRKTDLEVLSTMRLSKTVFSWKDRIFESIKFPVKLPSEKHGIGCYMKDITEEHSIRIKQEEQNRQIEYLSRHDSLTGLYNRYFLDEELKRLDTEANLPLSIIVADMNGLKLANDIFGHEAGDELLKGAAETIRKACRPEDVIARIGGDEYVIVLPRTTRDRAEEIMTNIADEFGKVKVKAIRGSISMGCDTKTAADVDIKDIYKNAESRMYFRKTLDKDKLKSAALDSIIQMLHDISPREGEHAINVSELSEKIGRAMGMSEVEVKRLKDAAYLHDIGKITLDEDLVKKYGDLEKGEYKAMRHHAVAGFRILNAFDNTVDLAETVLFHHEMWDGSGYPKGLKRDEIPLNARIIAVAEAYDAMTGSYRENPLDRAEAAREIKRLSGTAFDPNVVDIFMSVINSVKE